MIANWYNRICAFCNRRYLVGSHDGWIEIEKCQYCLAKQKVEKPTKYARRKERKKLSKEELEEQQFATDKAWRESTGKSFEIPIRQVEYELVSKNDEKSRKNHEQKAKICENPAI